MWLYIYVHYTICHLDLALSLDGTIALYKCLDSAYSVHAYVTLEMANFLADIPTVQYTSR